MLPQSILLSLLTKSKFTKPRVQSPFVPLCTIPCPLRHQASDTLFRAPKSTLVKRVVRREVCPHVKPPSVPGSRRLLSLSLIIRSEERDGCTASELVAAYGCASATNSSFSLSPLRQLSQTKVHKPLLQVPALLRPSRNHGIRSRRLSSSIKIRAATDCFCETSPGRSPFEPQAF